MLEIFRPLSLLLSFNHFRYKVVALLYIVLFSLLSGCDGGGCIYADDWGNKARINVTIPADQEYTKTGLTVYSGEPLFMRVGGLVDLCPDNLRIGTDTFPTQLVPDTKQWQNSGYRVSEGDFVTVLVEGSYQDRTGNAITDGRGLYMLIADVAEGSDAPDSTYDDDWWYGESNAYALNSPELKTIRQAPHFVELWNNGTLGVGAGFMGQVSNDGYVWFKYARTANPGDNQNRRQLNNSGEWNGRWSPWKGFWSKSDPECNLCTPETISLTCAGACVAALFAYGACVAGCAAGWASKCKSQERYPGYRLCRDLKGIFNTGGGTAWCGDSYTGGGSRGCHSWPANKDGYEINIGAGCPGSFGKYLYAYFANGNQDTPVRTQLFSPTGCNPANRDSCFPVFRDGRPVYTDSPYLNPGTPNFSMYYKENADFNSEGELVEDYKAPYTGRLWFKLQDDMYKPSDLVTMQKEGDRWKTADCSSSGTNCCIGPAECVDNPHANIKTADGSSLRPACNTTPAAGFERFGYDDAGAEVGNCRPARGYVGYSDNIGSYEVYVETTKIGSGFSAFLTGLVNSVRGILFGECMTDDSLSNASCFTKGYCIDRQPDEERCESDFGGTYVPGIGCTNGQAGFQYSEKQAGTTCPDGTRTVRSSLDYLYYCVKPTDYTEQKCADKGMLFSEGECVYDTRVTSGECVKEGGYWVPTRNDWKPGITQKLYNKFIAYTDQDGTDTANPFLNAVRASLLLYIIVFALFYMLGIIETPQKEFVVALFRILIIIQLISPASWDFFHRYLFTIFTDGMGELIVTVSGQFMGVMNNVGDNELIDPITGKQVLDPEGALPPQMEDESGNLVFDDDGNPVYGVITEDQMRPVKVGVEDPFAFVNQTIAMFFSPEVQGKLFGLFFSMFPIGIFFVLFIWWGMLTYVLAVVKAAILYIMAMLSIALLLAIAPIFISFMLFSRTRDIFEKWVMTLVNFLFQPVLVLTALALFNVFVYSALYMTLSYDVCWGCILHVQWDIPGIPIKFCVFWGYTTWGGAEDGAIPLGFYLIIIVLIMTNIAERMNDWMAKIAAELTSGDISTALSKLAGNMTNQLQAGAMAVGKMVSSRALGAMKGKDKKDDDTKKGEGSKGGSKKR